MASSVTADLLKQLSAASEGLNNVSDIFNDQIKVIEEAIASYNIGVAAWAQSCALLERRWTEDGSAFEFTRHISIGYEKWQGKWCLMVASWIPDIGESEKWVLRDAPRERRMQAISGIPELLNKLIDEAQKLTAEITSKTTEARMLAASIKPKKGK
jgi:hypothetical protein